MGGAVDADGLSGFLENGQNLFLTGSGGIGKTTLLHRLWRENVSTYRPERPVMIYISLAGYQENTGESGYLRRRLLELISFDGDVSDGCLSDLAGMALDKLLDGPEKALTAGVRLILLLDGLNEAGSHRVRLLKEIAALGRKKGVAVLVTGRTEDIKPYGFESFERLLLMPLAAAGGEKLSGG